MRKHYHIYGDLGSQEWDLPLKDTDIFLLKSRLLSSSTRPAGRRRASQGPCEANPIPDSVSPLGVAVWKDA
ncbi:MAG: hypothetical protein V4481_02770 [Patescibacteria group bacterium]